MFFIIYIIIYFLFIIKCVVCLFFHLGKPGKLFQYILPLHKPIGIYGQNYTVDRRQILRKLGIFANKFNKIHPFFEQNKDLKTSLVTLLAPKPRFMPKPGNNTIFAHKILFTRLLSSQ